MKVFGFETQKKRPKRKIHRRKSKFGLTLIWSSIFGRPTSKQASLRISVEEKILSLLNKRKNSADSLARALLVFLPALDDNEMEYLYVFLMQIKKPSLSDIIWGLVQVMQLRQRNGKKLTKQDKALLEFLSAFDFTTGEPRQNVSAQMPYPVVYQVPQPQNIPPQQVQYDANQSHSQGLSENSQSNPPKPLTEEELEELERKKWSSIDGSQWLFETKRLRHVSELPKYFKFYKDFIDFAKGKMRSNAAPNIMVIPARIMREIAEGKRENDPLIGYKALFAMHIFPMGVDVKDETEFEEIFEKWWNKWGDYVKRKYKPIASRDEFISKLRESYYKHDPKMHRYMDFPIRWWNLKEVVNNES